MLVENHRRRETEAVVRFAKARIVAAAQELIDRFAVAVRRVEIAKRVKAKSKRIDLAPGVLFDARAVEANAVSVARIHFYFMPVLAAHVSVVVVPVRRVEPAVEATGKRRVHSVRVAFPAKRAIELLFFVRFAIAVGVFKQPDIGDGPGDALPGFCWLPLG